MRTRVLATPLAVLAVLPMVAPLVWERGLPGLAFATDAALGALTPVEQPLTVRSFSGQWGLLLLVIWFMLAYTRRRPPLWELGLIVLGSTLALVRLGNVWLTAGLFVPALARGILAAEGWFETICRRGLVVSGLALAMFLVSLGSLIASRPPSLPVEASRAALAEPTQGAQGTVFTSWRWAPALQQELGPSRPVLGAKDLSAAYAMDYLRVSLAHDSWDALLRQYGVGLVVLDAADTQSGAAAQVRKSPDWQVALDRDGLLIARRVDR